MVINQNVKYDSHIERLSTLFAALGDPTRLAILERLGFGEATVTEIAAPFSVSLPAISRHLKVLERAGLIVRKHKAQWRACSVDVDSLREVADWATQYKAIWESSFDSLDAYLGTVQKNHGGVDASIR